MRSGHVNAIRVVAALLCAAGGVLLLLCCGIGVKFWTLVGIILVIMAFAAAYFIARRDYAAGATPAALAGIITTFMFLPPAGLTLLGVIVLFAATGIAYLLYEVD